MRLDFLPKEIFEPVKKRINEIVEIRLRVGFPVKVKIANKFYYLCKDEIRDKCSEITICKDKYIEEIIKTVTEHSLYAHNERIKQGYLDAGDGVRIGISGECVYDRQEISTIKNITSLNIRIPHEILGAASFVYKKIFLESKLLNTLILSPPMRGKTTILKDIARRLNEDNVGQIVIIDERGEFYSISGENIDKIIYSDKRFAFEYCIRTLSPNVVITDELSTVSDWNGVKYALSCGVTVIASCHAKDIVDLEYKKGFIAGIFDRYVLLSSNGDMGKILAIYDKEFNKI